MSSSEQRSDMFNLSIQVTLRFNKLFHLCNQEILIEEHALKAM